MLLLASTEKGIQCRLICLYWAIGRTDKAYPGKVPGYKLVEAASTVMSI